VETTISIKDFNTLLVRQQETDWLTQILRSLTTLEKPEDVQRILKSTPGAGWCGWG
jgi:hypothetical protein